MAERLGATLVPMGSAGAKAMAVVRGEADIYLHSGGQYEWDSAAPIAVAAAALRANHAALKLPDALVVATASVLGADRLLTTDRGWPTARDLGLNAAIVLV